MQSTAEDLDHSVAVLERRRKPLTIFLDASLLEGLREVASGHERSMAGEVRHMIRRHLEDEGVFLD